MYLTFIVLFLTPLALFNPLFPFSSLLSPPPSANCHVVLDLFIDSGNNFLFISVIMPRGRFVCLCASLCVCVRERERESLRKGSFVAFSCHRHYQKTVRAACGMNNVADVSMTHTCKHAGTVSKVVFLSECAVCVQTIT